MKIKKIAITILMTTFLIITGNKVEATTGKINSETVRIRKEPNTKSTIIDQLDKGDKVEVLEQEEDWYKIKVKTEQGTITGYISEKLLDIEETNNSTDKENQENNTNIIVDMSKEEETYTEKDNEITSTVETSTESIQENKTYILEQEITIKAIPLMSSTEVGKISGNIKIIEMINDWSRIENDTEIGWVRNNILKQILTKNETSTTETPEETTPEEPIITEPEPEPETEPKKETTDAKTEPEETNINKTGYVSAEGLRVREKPSTDSKELDSLSKNDKVEIIGQTGNWYKINLKGKTGYVSAKYISDTKLPDTTSRSGTSLKNTSSTEQENETIEEETEKNETTTGADVVEYAKQYLGYKYVSGGTTPTTGFDCSGFTSYVYKNFGVSLNRTSNGQKSNGNSVEKSELQLGDIVLFNNDANTAIGHVGIYIGDGNFIHASNPSDGVKITTLTTGYYQKRYVGARRVI